MATLYEETVAWPRLTYGAALEHLVARSAEREVFIFHHVERPGADGRSARRAYTAAEFSREVDRLARGLLALGVASGERVALWLANVPEAALAEFAVAKIGAILVPINTRFKEGELEYVLRQSEAATLITMERFGDTEYEAIVRTLCPETSVCAPGHLRSSRLPRLKRLITLGAGAPGMFAYTDVLALGAESRWELALRRREAEVRPDDVVLIQYTSGSTAFPKGVMLSHDQTLRNAFIMAGRAGLEESDRVLSAMPMFHIGGSVCALLGAVTRGYVLHVMTKFDAGETLRLFEEERITAYIGIETMFLMLRDHPDFSRRDRSSLRKGWAAGSPTLLRLIAEEIGISSVCSVYGLSECSPNVCITDWRDSLEKRVGTNGRPHPGVEVEIRDPQTGERLAPGQPGEICVRGYVVMKGYYNMPEETARTIDPDGWLHTGDRGLLTEDGYLVFLGRCKDVLRVGGENVSALEVENFLLTHPAVVAAAVVGVPDPRWGEVPAAFVQLKEGELVTEDDVIAYCREHLAPFKVPRYVRFVREFPMTGSGKIQKFLLREHLLAELEPKVFSRDP
ncbi:3-[(3aS,4S,7aS)-7a-methyl-1, 5-dioxo-octahydro-1H-inden-4-yl]propanoyl:CoA ligase [bacterium HR08]|nr:3-[(3aS,4S,7aS)-7a-methyl-1, 5-dioxo-octahydro-1H-inden-4-yl]propanoyl:CoA ligase [bacterium HR08]